MGAKRQMPATWLAKQRARWNRQGKAANPSRQAAINSLSKRGAVRVKSGTMSIDKAKAAALQELINKRQAAVKGYLTSEINDQGVNLEGESTNRIRPQKSRATGARTIRNQDNSITARSLAIGVGARQKYASTFGHGGASQQYVKNRTERNVHNLAFKSMKSKRKKTKS